MFLEILTRCCKRPNMLAINQASLDRQTCDDWQQTLLHDDDGNGIPAAQELLGNYAPHLEGDYIWILDDDDECCHNTLVAELKEIVTRESPDVIMLKMDHGQRAVLPSAHEWGQRPVIGRIGCSAYVVKRSLWRRCAGAWIPGRYQSDGDFIKAVYDQADMVYWHDVIASRVQWIGLGRPEPA